MKVKIIGAGSIGNHLAQACRRMGWDVTVVDADPKALERMKTDIYPTRYGAWDEGITLVTADAQPRGGFDVIMVGTPPHVRMKVALEMLQEKPRVLQLEKPLAAPFDPAIKEFVGAYRKQKSTAVIVGYDHAVAKSIKRAVEIVNTGAIGEVLTLDVEFREHWQGIFKAHPWLRGPEDTYLGFWQRGGGASGEHSHALHLWQFLARKVGLGSWRRVSAVLKVEREGKAEYDSIATFTLETDRGCIGRVVQDVITHPTRKWARFQGRDGFIEWHCGGHPTGDVIKWAGKDGEVREEVFPKKRPDDFYQETLHITDILAGKVKPADSPMSLESGIAVMEVLQTAWKAPAKALLPIEKL